jgi:hypothetical protein
MSGSRRPTEHRVSLLDRLDAALFAFAGLAAVWLAYLLVKEGVKWGWQSLLLIVFWVVVTYLLLPRLHRILTRLYVPDYFIGRARTSDGLLGDPVNLALLGTEAQVHQVMTAAGWARADDLSLATGRKIVTCTLTRRSYREAPVSPLHLFDRQQDFAYQQEVASSPSRRHHVRFWRCPEGWLLPGGYRVDWLAAGTYDRSVGLSLFTLQITHKIEADTDLERDFIVETVTGAERGATVEVIRDFSTGYHARNGGGDLIQTDGDLPVIDLTAVAATGSGQVLATDSRDKRPAQIAFGSIVALLRSVAYLLAAAVLVLVPVDVLFAAGVSLSETGLTAGQFKLVLVAVGAFLGLVGLVDVGLGLATFFGRNWARVLLMLSSVVGIVAAFAGDVGGSDVVTLATNLPTVGLSILVLLALSSHRARDYASRGRHLPKRMAGRPGAQTAF